MPNFTTKQGALFYCYEIDEELASKINKFLFILETSGVSKIIDKAIKESNIGRPSLNPYLMFAAIVYGFAMGSPTLRELETSCRYDIRFMYILGDKTPDHTTFSKYINKVIRPYSDEIFSCVVKAYLSYCNIELDECHLDGTKFEAKPNKYKVVFKPITYHNKLSDKVRALLSALNLSDGVPSEGIIPSLILANKVKETERLPIPEAKAEARSLRGKIISLYQYLLKSLEYEEKERICGDRRNSYYKTDHDATAMCLKADYYSGLGSNMHATYQIQSIACCGFVVSYYVSQDRNDMHTFIPSLERFYSMYGKYPKRITADSGYGNLENYNFCKSNNIEAYVKYLAWQGECSGRRPALYELQKDDSIKCIYGQTATRTEVQGRRTKIKNGEFYKVDCPEDCPFMIYCRRHMKEQTAKYRIFEINIEYQRLKQEARDRLLSVKGIELRVNRSCQIEGVFGITKYNMGYNRIRRVGLNRVSAEYMLTVLGLNTRKLFKFLDGKANFQYWVAPEDTQPETFKKPSAKRLANSCRKKHQPSLNEKAKSSYKYKKRGR